MSNQLSIERYQAYVRVKDDGSYQVYPLLTRNGPYVLYGDHSRAISRIESECPHHKKGAQCIWGLRGICNEVPCRKREDLRA